MRALTSSESRHIGGGVSAYDTGYTTGVATEGGSALALTATKIGNGPLVGGTITKPFVRGSMPVTGSIGRPPRR